MPSHLVRDVARQRARRYRDAMARSGPLPSARPARRWFSARRCRSMPPAAGSSPSYRVPSATSARPLATADRRAAGGAAGDAAGACGVSGLRGVPKNSFSPDGEIANSLRLVLPTISTLRSRAIFRQGGILRGGRAVPREVARAGGGHLALDVDEVLYREPQPAVRFRRPEVGDEGVVARRPRLAIGQRRSRRAGSAQRRVETA